MFENKQLVRAAYDVANTPAPLNEEECLRRDSRRARNAEGELIIPAAQAQVEQLRDAHVAWKRALHEKFPDESAEKIDAIFASVYAMKIEGNNFGYRLGETDQDWSKGLKELKARHPGFPKDLYLKSLQHGIVQSYF